MRTFDAEAKSNHTHKWIKWECHERWVGELGPETRNYCLLVSRASRGGHVMGCVSVRFVVSSQGVLYRRHTQIEPLAAAQSSELVKAETIVLGSLGCGSADDSKCIGSY